MLRTIACYSLWESDHVSLQKFLADSKQEPLTNAWGPGILDWYSNGCTWSPDYPFGFPFNDACIRHDFGYTNFPNYAGYLSKYIDQHNIHPNSLPGLGPDLVRSLKDPYNSDVKHRVDHDFKGNLYETGCAGTTGLAETGCKLLADAYYNTVASKLGNKAWAPSYGVHGRTGDSTESLVLGMEKTCEMPKGITKDKIDQTVIDKLNKVADCAEKLS
ncbi:hypothetical protein IU494_30315 [Nocardia terpenica]|nr:hypothetical protein [Nocardia terpenica]MBF6115215.1 hypothetical protein [Nocardia terpenica]MBF6122537.1 hypothetical protein [Nocardia terpenica]